MSPPISPGDDHFLMSQNRLQQRPRHLRDYCNKQNKWLTRQMQDTHMKRRWRHFWAFDKSLALELSSCSCTVPLPVAPIPTCHNNNACLAVPRRVAASVKYFMYISWAFCKHFYIFYMFRSVFYFFGESQAVPAHDDGMWIAIARGIIQPTEKVLPQVHQGVGA